MKTLWLVSLGAAFVALGSIGCSVSGLNGQAGVGPKGRPDTPKKTMQAFRSDDELRRYLGQLSAKQQARSKKTFSAKGGLPLSGVAGLAENKATDQDESITNVQHVGVDEGGIVKLHGQYLVILRRGRLFTVSIAGAALAPVSSVDAFAPDIDPRNTWYDEMLVSDDSVAVIGYSYERGGTEVGLFHIDRAGNLVFRSTYHLRSNDYYSSRNYASRLIGSKLIFYSPLYLYPGSNDPFANFPAVRKWHKGASAKEFQRIASASDIYRPETVIDSEYGTALHTVTTCDLAGGGFDCKATSVIGPWGRVFYVSPKAVYIWVTSTSYGEQQPRTASMLYRMPLDGSGPTALHVSGSPIDQFSFLESEDGQLNVLVRSEGQGDGMWGAEVSSGDIALMTVPVASFSDGSVTVEPSNYHRLPKPRAYTFQNRFVGEYLVYGSGSGWGLPANQPHSLAFAVHWSDGIVYRLVLSHGTDRIEQLGSDAVLVGSDGSNLHFTSVRLGSFPEVVDDFVRRGASQSELRSQGFFYQAEGQDSGLLGLPISVPGHAGYRHLFDSSAAILFLRNDSLHFQETGELTAQPERANSDGCRASCVDWYGNARPLFVRGRVIALLGYELVEGTLDGGSIREIRRKSYAPQKLDASNHPAEEKLQSLK